MPFDFCQPRPATPKADLVHVVIGEGGSLFVADSAVCAQRISEWLRTTTGQRCTVRPCLVYRLEDVPC